jgi:hypothetical protein
VREAHEVPAHRNRFLRNGLLIVSWPLLAVVMWLTSTKPANGQRWADANENRGSVLALTGAVWMFAMLLWATWWFTFSVVIPMLQRRRNSSHD